MTIAEQIQARRDEMTRAETQLADVILDNYPVSGLGSITELAEKAKVSTPTVARMVQKLGFSGYAPFQAALRTELGEMISGPVAKHDTIGTRLPQEHVLTRYALAAMDNLRGTIDQIEAEDFDAVCALIADPARRIHIAGGRITGTLARHLYLHLQMIRPGVTLVPLDASWSHHMLDLAEGDLLIAFDVRRYENNTLLMAQMAHEQGAQIALFTDPWRSPIHRIAQHCFAGRIAVPSAWDSSMSLMLLVECMVAAVQEHLWDEVKARNDRLEAAFDRTKLFRKFT
ncbi:MurR/RpiR family transcriptional regulator [Aliishimia ponticola]|uniref:MurR/RpiR family transcriptional regulator n=1 Tax=Aliishimia ponticola TaxID=2499833 RepID=A0A4S4NS87_9RHOB|nr:MurR/RpiR family transcriptional regulator [Aliishimia ponticola]THH39090.1 MurR/RpiR family transcriptional regulator [Aliishimia ponticola]